MFSIGYIANNTQLKCYLLDKTSCTMVPTKSNLPVLLAFGTFLHYITHSYQQDDSYCPYGWQLFNRSGSKCPESSCWLYVPIRSNRAEALEDCRSRGGDLASFHCSEESAFAQRLLPRNVGQYNTPVYSGLDDSLTNCVASKSCKRQWSDGTDFDYSNWCSNEPNGHPLDKCGKFLRDAGELCLGDYFCSIDSRYFCRTAVPRTQGSNKKSVQYKWKVTELQQLLPYATISTGKSYCPYGWQLFNSSGSKCPESSCWLYVPILSNRAEALEDCRSRGGDLASIHCSEESAFAQRLLPRNVGHYNAPVYSGLDDSLTNCVASKSCKRQWSDGTDFDYSNWCSNEPNGHPQDKCGKFLRDAGELCLGDYFCSIDSRYFCRVSVASDGPRISQIFTVGLPTAQGKLNFYGEIHSTGSGYLGYLSAYLKLDVDRQPYGAQSSATVAYKISILKNNRIAYDKFPGDIFDFSVDRDTSGYQRYIYNVEIAQYLEEDNSATFQFDVAVLHESPMLLKPAISKVSEETYIWHLQHFTDLLDAMSTSKLFEGYQYRSPEFIVRTDELQSQWQLVMFPNGNGKSDTSSDNISLYLKRTGRVADPEHPLVPADVRLTILDVNGVNVHKHTFQHTYTNVEEWNGYSAFISKRELLNPKNTLLSPEGELIISVTIRIAEDNPYSVQPPPLTAAEKSSSLCGQAYLEDTRNDFSGAGSERSGMLLGGPVTPGSYPYQASLRIRHGDGESSHRCGAAIIHKQWLITAAHCITNVLDYVVRVGDHHIQQQDFSETEFDVERYVIHPLYDSKTASSADIALIRIKSAVGSGKGFAFNSYVQPICLADSHSTRLGHTECFITGWGDILTPRQSEDDELWAAKVKPVETDRCSQKFGIKLPNAALCGVSAGGSLVNSCYGDSGTPLSCIINGRLTLLGVTSQGAGRDCGAVIRPGVYASVPVHRQWIRETIHSPPPTTLLT